MGIPGNLTAKHARQRASYHKQKKRAAKMVRGDKHKKRAPHGRPYSFWGCLMKAGYARSVKAFGLNA